MNLTTKTDYSVTVRFDVQWCNIYAAVVLLQNQTLNLDLSAKVLLGDPLVDQQDVGKFKSE